MEPHKPIEKVVSRKRELLAVAGRKMAPQRCPCPDLTVHDKEDFADVIKLRALTWGDYPELFK